MRSAVIILVCLAALVAGFAVFMLMEPAPPAVRHVERTTINTTMPTPPSATQQVSGPGVGAGKKVWIQSFDKKTGQLVSEFKADKYDPPVDNQVHVVNANARFYEKNGQIMTMEAATGDMVMPEQARKSESMTAMSAQPPSHGILYDVTIQLYDAPDSVDAPLTDPTLTCKMPILSFDNDTLSLATIATRLAGQDVSADRIPVTVRGRDYDFDGTGLKLRYNQRDQHLEFLQIAHGRRLLIKHPKNVGNGPTIGSPVAAPSTQPLVPAALNGVHADATPLAQPVMLGDAPLQLAEVDKSVAAQMSAEDRELHRRKRLAATRAAAAAQAAATQAAATQKTKEIVAYHATFDHDVKLKQGDTPLGGSDQMVVTFTFDNDSSTAQPAVDADEAPAAQQGPRPTTTETNVSTSSANEASAPKPGAPKPGASKSSAPTLNAPETGVPAPAAPHTAKPLAGTGSADAAPAPSGAPDPASASADEQPIEVTWNGPLTVVPLKLADSGLKSASDHIVEFTGSPVHLVRDGSSIESPYVWAGVEGDRFAAKGSDQFPVITLKDAQGLTLKTHAIDSTGDVVTIHGDSVATNTLPATDNAPEQTMVTKWTDVAHLHVITTSAGDRAIDHAQLLGNVDVLHPQMHMTGDALELGFVPSANSTQPTISAVKVAGHVVAAIKGQDGAEQTIAANTLDLATAQQGDGSVAVKSVHANGNVKAVNAGQTLLSDDLVAMLLPPDSTAQPAATQPGGLPTAAALDHLVATGNVHFSTPQGTAATADILKVDRRPTLEGQPAMQDISLLGTPAVVTDPTSKVTGKLIKLDSTGQTASVVGAGTLDGQAHAAGSDSSAPPRPMHVTWDDSLDYDGADNRVRLSGNVVITSLGSDGATDRAVGKTLDLVLADSPKDTTRDSAQDSAQVTTQPGPQPVANAQPADSMFGGAGQGKIVKQMTLSDNVQVSSITPNPNNPAQPLRRMNMFSPQVVLTTAPDGSIATMVVPAAGRMLMEDNSATTQPATAPNAAEPNAAQPNAAQSMSAQSMSAQGKTAVAWSKNLTYDTIAKKATLLGDVVVVHESSAQDPMRLTAPRMVADLDQSATGQSQIKQVVADGGATFSNSKIRFESDHATYQPQDDRVIATGTARQPVEVFDETGLSTGSFDEMWWNVKTNQPERLKNINVQSRSIHGAPRTPAGNVPSPASIGK